MFIENPSSEMRTPAGCYVPASFQFYENGRRTLQPAGVRPRKSSSL